MKDINYKRFECPPLVGRYVSIRSNLANDYVTICELEVFGSEFFSPPNPPNPPNPPALPMVGDGEYVFDFIDSTDTWKLVRRVQSGSTWHPADDNLAGTAVYGTYNPDYTVCVICVRGIWYVLSRTEMGLWIFPVLLL